MDVIVPDVLTGVLGVGVGVGVGGGVELVTNDNSATVNTVDVSLARVALRLTVDPACKFVQAPPVYCVADVTLNV